MNKPLVLIVDDDVNNRELLEAVLRVHDYNTICTNRGNTAINLARERQPALILADINMPGMSGYDLCRNIRADQSIQHIPIILVSGVTNPEEQREKALKAGANDLVERITPMAELIRRVQSLIPNE